MYLVPIDLASGQLVCYYHYRIRSKLTEYFTLLAKCLFSTAGCSRRSNGLRYIRPSVRPSVQSRDSCQCSYRVYVVYQTRPDQTRPDVRRAIIPCFGIFSVFLVCLNSFVFCVVSTVLRVRCYLHLRWYYFFEGVTLAY